MQNNTAPNDLISAAYHLLDELKIRHSKAYVNDFLREHVDYPSMGALIALLNDFNIDNAAVRLNFEKFMEMPLPAIAYLKEEGKTNGKFSVVTKLGQTDVTYIDSDNKIMVEPLNEFISKWTGAVLVAQKNEYSGSVSNDEAVSQEIQKRSSRIVIGIVSLLALGALAFSYNLTSVVGLLLLLKAVGVVLFVFLMADDLGIYSSIIHSVCTVGGLKKENGCSRVSNSKAASVFGIKMSEIGLFYFTGGMMVMLVSLTTGQNILPFAYLLAVATIPYTIFSLIYQMKVVKEVCALCIGVILILWSECLILGLSGTSLLPADIENVSTVVIFHAIPLLMWLALRKNIYGGATAPDIRKQLKIFKSSPDALTGSLIRTSRNVTFDVHDKIVLNENGEINVRAVMSYFCPSCGAMMQDILTLASQNELIRFEIIFVTGELSYDNIARSMLVEKHRAGNAGAIQFVRNWYHGKVDDTIEYNSLSREAMADIQFTIESWKKYVLENNINTTPMVYIDNFLKPNGIRLLDYKVLFDEKARQLQLTSVA